VECGIIEPNGIITLFTMKQMRDALVEPEVLKTVPMYKSCVSVMENWRRSIGTESEF
jgi:hypothetical protein